MRAAFVRDSAKVQIENIDRPTLGHGEVLVKMHSCGICGSDIEKIYGRYSQPSMRLGHEPSGVVSEVDTNVTGFKKGDRVFAHHHVPCYSCHYCINGNETMCEKYYETNLTPCGLSEEFVVPAWNVNHGGVIKIPDSMSFDEAAMIEPLACCVRAWNKIKLGKGDSVAIFGVGPTGMMHVMLSEVHQCGQVFCFDVNDFRLNFAKKFKITEAIKSTDPNVKEKVFSRTENRGVDVAIVATGNLTALSDAIDCVRKGGIVILFGVPSRGATLSLDVSKVYSKEVTIIPSYAASDKDTMSALNLIRDSKVDVAKLITHKYDLLDSQKAFRHAHERNDSMKIIITSSVKL
ncbi:MAG: zinc-dependent dehydrogenase [Nitrosopumilaceae archaeon]